MRDQLGRHGNQQVSFSLGSQALCQTLCIQGLILPSLLCSKWAVRAAFCCHSASFLLSLSVCSHHGRVSIWMLSCVWKSACSWSMCVCMYVHTCVHMHVCVSACVYMCVFVCLCVCMCMHACMYVYVYACMCVCVYVHTWVHTFDPATSCLHTLKKGILTH